jgi:hypothetical protein
MLVISIITENYKLFSKLIYEFAGLIYGRVIQIILYFVSPYWLLIQIMYEY